MKRETVRLVLLLTLLTVFCSIYIMPHILIWMESENPPSGVLLGINSVALSVMLVFGPVFSYWAGRETGKIL